MRMTLAAVTVFSALSIGTATAHEPGPFDVKQGDVKAPLPKGVKAKGKTIEQVWTWQDGDMLTNGLAVFSSTDTEKDGRVVARKIFVQYYRGKGGKLTQVRLVQDNVPTCEFDVVAEFIKDSVVITDDDGDEISELSFAYDLDCTSDVSPHTRKLLVLEGKDKHALRGQSRIPAMGTDPAIGGDYKLDGFKKAPELKSSAEALWKSILDR